MDVGPPTILHWVYTGHCSSTITVTCFFLPLFTTKSEGWNIFIWFDPQMFPPVTHMILVNSCNSRDTDRGWTQLANDSLAVCLGRNKADQQMENMEKYVTIYQFIFISNIFFSNIWSVECVSILAYWHFNWERKIVVLRSWVWESSKKFSSSDKTAIR